MKDRIKAARKSKGWSQDKLAEELGVSRPTVARYESGEFQPNEATIQLMAIKTECDVNWLRTGSGEMHPPLSTEEQLSEIFGRVAISSTVRDHLIRSLVMALDGLTDPEAETLGKALEKIAERLAEQSK